MKVSRHRINLSGCALDPTLLEIFTKQVHGSVLRIHQRMRLSPAR